MKVLKFGGSSVGSADSIRLVLQAIEKEYQQNKELIIVCSALSGITTTLQETAIQTAQGNSNFSTVLKEMESRHVELIYELLEPKFQNEILIQHKLFFNELEELFYGVSAVQEASKRTLDKIISYGELLSNTMMAQLIHCLIGNAFFVDSRKLLVTNSNFGNAQLNFDATQTQIEKWIFSLREKPGIQVISGFIASDEKGITTTLGRGGSDYTAAIVASFIGAEEIQIWTDVDGFMTADPRLVPEAISLPELSYSEAMELSYFGAKVIYPPTMIPAIEKQIPIVIKNTFNQKYNGTYIHKTNSSHVSLARGIASINDVCLINIEGSGMVGFRGFSGRLFGALAQKQVNVIMITQASSEHSICIVVEPKDLLNAQDAIAQEFEFEIFNNKIEKIGIEEEVSVLAVVGENMRHTEGMAGKTFQALGRVGVNIIAIVQGSSELNISVVIKKDSLPKALNSIHNDLFLSKTRNAHLVVVGVGNIGKTLLNQIKEQKESLEKYQDFRLNLIGISNSKQKLINLSGIDLNDWENQLKSSEEISWAAFISQVKKISLPDVVFVDNTGSPEVSEYYKELLDSNISVVTCNKIATSSSQEYYDSLNQIALKNNVSFLYETNVGAGLPIIKTIQDLIHSGDRIIKIEAILSGTISFIFNNYVGEKTFTGIVKEAQEKGYTEPNPADDLSGKDFARKMLILAREIGLKLELEEVEIHPILPKECLEAKNLEEFYSELTKAENHFDTLKKQAENQNSVLRYIGTLENGKASVKIEMVSSEHPFYGLTGSDNIISITTQRYLYNPLVVKGPGAGAEVTAAGVFADIMRAASHY